MYPKLVDNVIFIMIPNPNIICHRRYSNQPLIIWSDTKYWIKKINKNKLIKREGRV